MKQLQASTRLKKLRKLNGLTQKQLANLIGVTQGTISKYESGEKEPRKEIRIKLARLFGVSVEWLFYESVYGSQPLPQPTGTEDAV
jgi:transcriptional regulator with XRE-family HTH domain